MVKKLGIYGGSFDPPHNGHIAVAEECRLALGLDEVMFVPNNQNPLRRATSADASDRLEMVRLAIEGLEGFSVSDIEVTRGGKSYTVDTIDELRMVFPAKIWLVVGADALLTIDSWHESERLPRLCRIAAVSRPGTELPSVLSRISEDIAEIVDLVEMKPVAVSSSRIREALERGHSAEQWVSQPVWEYIKNRGLYQA